MLENLLLHEKNNVFLIDWLSVTFHGCFVDQVMEILGLQSYPWVESTSFINGYPRQSTFSNIHIRWGADDIRFYSDSMDKNGVFRSASSKVRDDMGIQLEMSGQGCRSFEEFSDLSWNDLILNIFRLGGRVNVTRLDLAYDDHIGILDIHQMRSDVEERNYISKSKKSMVIWSDDQERDLQGLTLQIGSRSSPVLIRIYDKSAERGYDSSKHWIRVELQLRQDRAGEALRLLFQRESVGIVVSGILRNYCTFVEPGMDSNRSRWQIAGYWHQMLLSMEKIRLWISPGEPYNFSKAENHLIHQYGQFIQAYYAVHGEIGSLLDRSKAAHKRLNPKYRNAINAELAAAKRLRSMRASLMDELGFSDPDPDSFVEYQQVNFAELLIDDQELPPGW